MPDPTYQQPDSAGFPGAVLRRIADVRAFEEAGEARERMTETFAVLRALQVLTDEVRQLRAAIEPSSSPIVHGAEALREFKRLQENHHA